MTRRIATAILLTVWAMLIAGGLLAYFVTRSILLADLDASLTVRAVSRAVSLTAQTRTPTTEPSVVYLGGDRYVVKNQLDQTVARPPSIDRRYFPELLSAHFSQVDGKRSRTVLVKYYVVPLAGGQAQALTIPYSDSAEQFDSLLRRLEWALIVFGVLAGLATAAVAVRVSRTALSPLNRTAEQIGTIDERRLDRRIDVAALPIELHPMAQRLNEMLARIQQAFELQSRFLADASHELRTPVAALTTTLDVALNRERDADAYRRTLETCRNDALQLRRLVERLMEQVRSQNLSHDEPAKEIDVAQLLRECADNVAPLAEVRGIKLVRQVPERLPYRVAPTRLRSVVMNLLSNAVEYNQPSGTVELTCAALNGDGLKLKVADTGRGIPAEHLPHLFEPFYRVDEARESQAGHLGLGLSLVQAHVQAMSGQCRVESHPGVGTTFFVDLPGEHG
jgi:signal transduction histidine kinase